MPISEEMSVNAIDRKPSSPRLVVEELAANLYSYTVRAASNHHVVPKRQKWLNGPALCDAARSVCTCISLANACRLDTEEGRTERVQHQKMALAQLRTLSAEVYLCWKSHPFKDQKLHHWVGLMEDVRAKLNAWMQSDGRRVSSGEAMYQSDASANTGNSNNAYNVTTAGAETNGNVNNNSYGFAPRLRSDADQAAPSNSTRGNGHPQDAEGASSDSAKAG